MITVGVHRGSESRRDRAALMSQGHRQHVGQVKRAAARRLRDLLATAEAVGDQQRVAGCSAHGGQQHALAHRHGDVVVARLEAEAAGHAAATAVRDLDVQLEPVQHSLVRVEVQDGFLMTMPVHERTTMQQW